MMRARMRARAHCCGARGGMRARAHGFGARGGMRAESSWLWSKR